MRRFGTELALGCRLAVIAAAVFVGACGPGETPVVPAPAGTPAAKPAPDKPSADRPPAGSEEERESGEERDSSEPEPGAVDPQEEADRIMPKDPYGILIAPDDETKVFSYWRDAQAGDWIRFLTHQQKAAVFEVIERDGKNIKMEARHYELDGKEIPKKERDIRPMNIEEDDKVMRQTLVGIPFLVRTIYDWQLFNSDKVLHCERRTVDNPTGENNESCYAWDVRCGGYVFQRRGNNTYVLLIDYGDARNGPKWEHLKPAELLKYWYKWNRFIGEEEIPQEDPARGEPPEKPEDEPAGEVAETLKAFNELTGAGLAAAVEGDRFKDALESLDRADALLEGVVSYARANNYLPALRQSEKVKAGLAALRAACAAADKEKAAPALRELKDSLAWFYASVNYNVRPQKKR